jgi:chromosome segregation ATPase
MGRTAFGLVSGLLTWASGPGLLLVCVAPAPVQATNSAARNPCTACDEIQAATDAESAVQQEINDNPAPTQPTSATTEAGRLAALQAANDALDTAKVRKAELEKKKSTQETDLSKKEKRRTELERMIAGPTEQQKEKEKEEIRRGLDAWRKLKPKDQSDIDAAEREKAKLEEQILIFTGAENMEEAEKKYKGGLLDNLPEIKELQRVLDEAIAELDKLNAIRLSFGVTKADMEKAEAAVDAAKTSLEERREELDDAQGLFKDHDKESDAITKIYADAGISSQDRRAFEGWHEGRAKRKKRVAQLPTWEAEKLKLDREIPKLEAEIKKLKSEIDAIDLTPLEQAVTSIEGEQGAVAAYERWTTDDGDRQTRLQEATDKVNELDTECNDARNRRDEINRGGQTRYDELLEAYKGKAKPINRAAKKLRRIAAETRKEALPKSKRLKAIQAINQQQGWVSPKEADERDQLEFELKPLKKRYNAAKEKWKKLCSKYGDLRRDYVDKFEHELAELSEWTCVSLDVEPNYTRAIGTLQGKHELCMTKKEREQARRER